MPKYRKENEEKLTKERRMGALRYLQEKGGRVDMAAVVSGCPVKMGEGLTRKTLNDLVACGFVAKGHAQGKAMDGHRNTVYYSITQLGTDHLIAMDAAEPVGRKEVSDWSQRPSLMDGGETVAVAPSAAVPEEPEDAPEVPEGPEQGAEEDAPAEAAPETPAHAPAQVDVDSLAAVLSTLRTLSPTEADDIDFDIAALTAKVEDRLYSAARPCPCCGGAMSLEKAERYCMLLCGGCGLAVSWRNNPRSVAGLIKAFNRRV